MKQVLAFDFGASSGRAMLGQLTTENGVKRITLEELHRFENSPVKMGDTLYWDFPRLLHEVRQGLLKTRELSISSIGIDTWGVDFGLIGKDGELLQNPVHYRDTRTEGYIVSVDQKIGIKKLYYRTGCQTMALNTVFQLCYLRDNKPWLLENTERVLLMPDLFNYYLTNQMAAEKTIASTTQMYSTATGDWDYKLLVELGINAALLPQTIEPGQIVGNLTPSLCSELGIPSCPVVAVPSHDTASAVMAAPAVDTDFLFVSCGTWSLFGTELPAPIMDDNAYRLNIANEAGYGGKCTFLKNIIGLWLVQETRRQFIREGKSYSYADMEALAKQSKPFGSFIDPNAPEFVPPGDIPSRIRSFCTSTNQQPPRTDGEIIRCIYESIAMEYRHAMEQIQMATGKTYTTLHMLGGGTKDGFLCDMTASSTGCSVKAGPVEATAIGNIATQLIALGEIADLKEAREIVAASFPLKEYEPTDISLWEENYKRYKELL